MKRRTKAQILEDARAVDAKRIADASAHSMPIDSIPTTGTELRDRMITLPIDEAMLTEASEIGISYDDVRAGLDRLNAVSEQTRDTLTLDRLERWRYATALLRNLGYPSRYEDANAGIAVYCVDSLDVMKQLRAACITTGVSDALRLFDVTITDPPYSDATHKGARTGDVGVTRFDGTFTAFDRLTIRSAFRSILALTRRWTVSTVDIRHLQTLIDYFDAQNHYGRFIRAGAWVKENPAPQLSGDRPAQGWEAIAILHRQGQLRWNGHGRAAVWHNRAVRGKSHPAEKPIAMIESFVSLFSDSGDLIFDPFCGAGTTLLAAKLLGRSAIGFELDTKYVDHTIARLQQQPL